VKNAVFLRMGENPKELCVTSLPGDSLTKQCLQEFQLVGDSKVREEAGHGLSRNRRMSRKVRHGRKGWERCAQSVFENSVLGSTGHWPLPSGDSPHGKGATVRANGHGVFATMLAEVPAGR